MNVARKSISYGFTLIEASIVMIIVGLVLGAVVIGQDLIAAAKARSQISQLEEFNTAVITFRIKYGQMPGDLLASDASNLGFTARSGARGHGDGNQLIERCNPESTFGVQKAHGCENILFWSDLSAAEMIEGTFTRATDADMSSDNLDETLEYFPEAKAARDAVVIMKDTSSRMWFILSGLNYQNAGGGTLSRKIPSAIAYSIDSKMDDGSPMTGRMRHFQYNGAALSEFYFGNPTQTNIHCVFNNEYNLTSTVRDNCSPAYRMEGSRR